MKQFFLYILYSKILDKYYVGQTSVLENRLEKHLEGTTHYTKRVKDWRLVYSEAHRTRAEAVQRERFVKTMKSRKFIEDLVNRAG